jgi:cytosine/adenosine deaminase-related metal-dependent hydrolase
MTSTSTDANVVRAPRGSKLSCKGAGAASPGARLTAATSGAGGMRFAAADRLDPESMHDVARRCFRQMRRVGYTAVHVDEQVREIDQSLDEYGKRPIEVLDHCGVLGERMTVIRARRAGEHEIELLRMPRSTVCFCPTSEGNLGDGWPPAATLVERGIPLAIGTDSNVRLDPFEGLREVELYARRVAQRRGVLFHDAASPAVSLLDAGWNGGALALGVAPAQLRAGAPTNLIDIDLQSDVLAGVAE